jgi:hypothetical protein
VVLVVGGWNVLASNVLHGDVTPRKLYLSVENEVGGSGPLPRPRNRVCRPVEAGVWSCDVADLLLSPGRATYRVSVHGSCWHATGSARDLPHTLSGCVHIHED